MVDGVESKSCWLLADASTVRCCERPCQCQMLATTMLALTLVSPSLSARVQDALPFHLVLPAGHTIQPIANLTMFYASCILSEPTCTAGHTHSAAHKADGGSHSCSDDVNCLLFAASA